MIVYITTNIINGKKYIGKDTRNRPNYLGSGKILRRAITKYGKENFIKETLCEAKDQQDLCELEIYYIDYYGADKSDLFYNITKGGDGGETHDQSYKKVKINQYTENGILIKTHLSARDASNELGILRVGVVKACNERGYYKGFLWSYLDKPIVERGIPTYNRKKLGQYDLEGNLIRVFDSVKEAFIANHINKTTIHYIIQGKNSGHPYKYRYLS